VKIGISKLFISISLRKVLIVMILYDFVLGGGGIRCYGNHYFYFIAL